jgi:lipopolysaccharide export system permease protein
MPAPLGWHTRVMIASYARHTFLVACAILVLALSIDLTLFLTKVVATVSQWPNLVVVSLAWYVVLRGTDFLAELLPLACFIGVFWAEIVHTNAQERLIVWLSGRAARQCLVPTLLFGAIVGLMQFSLNVFLRPMAVMTMAADHLGSYGERFDPRPQPHPQWIAVGLDLIQAVIEPGSPPLLRDVRLYRMNDALALRSFHQAKLAKPIDDHSWVLIDGHRWTSPLGTQESRSFWDQNAFTGDDVPFDKEELDLKLTPAWINAFHINARYLPNDVFSALRRVDFSPNAEFQTWEQARLALCLFCAAMPLLAATLSMLLLPCDIRLGALAIVGVAGYMANSGMKLLILLGEHGYVSPWIAAWAMPALLLAVCAATVTVGSRIETIAARFFQGGAAAHT